ncbi:MAG: sugar phosphate isomerase/epimerase, partial [Planctomycetota bacterium]
MKTIKGPAIFLAQYMGERPPFNAVESITAWARELGFVGVQVPTWDARAIDLEKAAKSKAYCDDYLGKLAAMGLSVTELSTHLQGQLVAVHPAYDSSFDAFA